MTKFQPGQSGNPAGRPKGTLDRRKIFRELVEPHKNDLIKKATEMALSGNEQMMRILLNRILPAIQRDDPIKIDGLDKESLEKQVNKIVELTADGTLTATESDKLLKMFSAKTLLLEIPELQREIAELKKNR